MRIGFDIDGVLASFESQMVPLLVSFTGRNLFPPDFTDIANGPPVWDWIQLVGYTAAEEEKAWKAVTSGHLFWTTLEPLPGMTTLQHHWRELERRHSVYFVTNRPGASAKHQTESWLQRYLLPYDSHPTVLISAHKGLIARALGLDVYADDHTEYVWDVRIESPETRCYLLSRTHNQGATLPSSVKRIRTLSELFEHELPEL